MPLVRINAPELGTKQLEELGRAAHEALVSAFGIPPDDHFQILCGDSRDIVVYDPGYLGVERDRGIAFVQVFCRSGREVAKKKAFYRALAENAAAIGVEPRNLVVVLTENEAVDWSFGEGIAQYAE